MGSSNSSLPPQPPQNPNTQAVMNMIYNTNPSAPTHYHPTARNSNFNLSPPASNTTSAAQIRPDAVILKSTIALNDVGEGRFSVTFNFNSTVGCYVNVYQFAELKKGQDGESHLYTDERKYPSPVGFSYGSGQDQVFPVGAVIVDGSRYRKEELMFKDLSTYPLVLEIIPYYTDGRPPQKHRTFIMYTPGPPLGVRVIRQVFVLGNTEYVLQDIFGFENATSPENQSECVVCLSEPKIMAIMPCRHVCICEECSESLGRQRNSKCPICRGIVENFMKLEIRR